MLGGLISAFNNGLTAERRSRPFGPTDLAEPDRSLFIFVMTIAGIALVVGVNIWLGETAIPYG